MIVSRWQRKFIANLIPNLVPMLVYHHPANIPTRYWLTPSGVSIPTSENTSEINSGLRSHSLSV